MIQKKIQSTLSVLPYSCAFYFAASALLGVFYGGYAPLAVGIFYFGTVALIELVSGMDGYNPTKDECKYLENKFSFRLITWLWVPVQIILAIVGTIYVGLHWSEMNWVEFIGSVFVIGANTGGIGITVAHELIHKQNWFEQTLGRITLHFVSYTHFYIEHLQGHHKRVATEDDPATAKFGEDVYTFIVKSVYGGYKSAWNIEAKRLAKAHLPLWSIRHNQMIQYAIATIVTFGLFYLIAGFGAVIFFFCQSVWGFALLEVINYIEHYGLKRKEVGGEGSKVYEKVTPFHSWNADHPLTNYFIFKLQRHADHHTWPTRRYQTLRSWDFSPQLPTGYIGMLIVAFFPPLFHSLMDPRVIKYNSLIYEGNRDD